MRDLAQEGDYTADREGEGEGDDGTLVASLTNAAPGDNRINYRVESKYPWARDKTGQVSFTVRFGPTLSLPRAVP